MNINCTAKKLIALLNAQGYTAYAVGGCVRDALMDVEPHDTDLCTSALPEQIIAVLECEHISHFDSGLKHGTVSAVVGDEIYEITTFRTESTYSDSRHPDKVEFVSEIAADLARRDFTVNAMAYCDSEGVIDPYGGQEDLKRKVIRAVGDPRKRFEEDALRILRALRFASTLGFEIDTDTSTALVECKDLLQNISKERIREEFVKLLCGKWAGKILTEYHAVLEVFLPELRPLADTYQNHPYHMDTVLEHTVKVVDSVKPEPVLRVAALLHDVAKPKLKTTDESGTDHFYNHPTVGSDMARDILHRLKFSNAEIHEIVTLVKNHDNDTPVKRKQVLRALNKLGEQTLKNLLELKLADAKGQSPQFLGEQVSRIETARELINQVIDEQACFSLKDLAVTGKDLVSLGYSGKEIGEKLGFLLSAVLEGKCENEKEKLLELL